MKRSSNNKQTQHNMNNNIEFAAVTNWIAKEEAQNVRKELIASGLDKKQVKLSSYRWADIKDHDKGYICRVLVVKGLRPEMEVETTRPRKQSKNAIGSFASDLTTGNTCDEVQNMIYFCRRNAVDETMTA